MFFASLVGQDYDIVLPLMAAAGVSSLVVELFSRADAPAVQPMPRDMSLEIGLKISGKVDKLMGKIQVGGVEGALESGVT